MPQVVDFESLVCCGDGKVACETLADAPEPEDDPPSRPPPQDDDPDLPADSFRLPLADVLDWISRNAAVAAPYDRDESTRGGAHPKSAAAAAPHHHNKHSGPLRYATKRKGPIIGLPNKVRTSGYVGQSARRHAPHGRFFPRKAGGDGSSVGRGRTSSVTTSSTLEPTSPKVSCFGRVLADQDQCRRRRAASAAQGVSRESSSVSTAAPAAGGIAGLWGVLMGLSCCRQQRDAALLGEEETASTPSGAFQAAAVAATSNEQVLSPVMAPPVPGLGGMMRLASGRRAASWGGNLELEQVLEEAAGSAPSPRRLGGEQGILPGRRSVGSPADLDGDRDWEGGGCASV